MWCRVGARGPWVSLGTPWEEVTIYCETDHSLERINLILRLDPPSVSHTFLFAEVITVAVCLEAAQEGWRGGLHSALWIFSLQNVRHFLYKVSLHLAFCYINRKLTNTSYKNSWARCTIPLILARGRQKQTDLWASLISIASSRQELHNEILSQ